MAQIQCPECGNEISDKTAFCIHCGCPLFVSRPDAPHNAALNESSLFKVASTERAPVAQKKSTAAPSAAPAKSYEEIKTCLKDYKPNGFIKFLGSRGYFRIFILYITFIVYMLINGGLEDAALAAGIFAPIFVPLLFALFLCPINHFKRYLRKNGLVEFIRSDSGHMNVAILTYNAHPSKRTLAYIRRLNPAAAEKIEQQLADK